MGTVDDDARKAAKREANREAQRRSRERQIAADPDGYRARKAEYARRWREANPDAWRAIGERGKGRAAARRIERRHADPERAAWLDREAKARRMTDPGYAQRQRELATASRKRRRAANPEKVAAQKRAWWVRWREANPDAYREQVARTNRARKARRYGVEREPWTTGEILDRDGWECQLEDCRCPAGRQIDPGAVRGSRWAGEVDHIHPISKGGADTLDNLRAAHRSCNAAKGNRVD
jgi:5-methylcytosine-specific restriction endonuclease McrA